MRTNLFFTGSWIIQLIVGIGLFGCSFFVEYQILLHFVSPATMAFFLAIILESGKVAAIVWHHYLGYLAPETTPTAVNLTSFTFRFGLVTLSLLCSMLFFTARLDRPHLEMIKAKRSAAIVQQNLQETKRIDSQFNSRKNELQARQQQELKEARKMHDKQIATLDTLLLAEMDNVINGVFKGSRYQEFERRVEKEKRVRDNHLAQIRKQHELQQEDLDTSFNKALRSSQSKANKLQQSILKSDFATDEQAHDKRIVALLKTVESIFHWDILPLQFVFCFSILISFLMETGIMLSFATITVAIAPVLHAHHIDVLEKETCRIQTEGEVEKDAMRHGAAISKVRQAGERVVNEANSFYQKHAQQN